MNRDDPKERPKAEELLKFIDKTQVFDLFWKKI